MSGQIELRCRYDVASGAQEVEEIERRGVPNLGEKETWYVFINWSTHQPIGLITSSWLPVPASLPPVDLVLASGIESLLYSCYIKAGESSRKAWIPRPSARLLTYPYATSRSSNVAVVHISFFRILIGSRVKVQAFEPRWPTSCLSRNQKSRLHLRPGQCPPQAPLDEKDGRSDWKFLMPRCCLH